MTAAIPTMRPVTIWLPVVKAVAAPLAAKLAGPGMVILSLVSGWLLLVPRWLFLVPRWLFLVPRWLSLVSGWLFLVPGKLFLVPRWISKRRPVGVRPGHGRGGARRDQIT
jgi:hypothetical protein